MSIVDKHQAPANIPTPSTGYSTFFIRSDTEVPALKFSDGSTTDLIPPAFAEAVLYTPTDTADWPVDPTNAEQAFDYLAASVTDVAARTTVLEAKQVYTKGAAWINGGAPLVALDANIVYAQMPLAGTITRASIITDGGPGSCEINIWLDTFANFPPLVADSIVGATPPTITADTTYEDTTLSDWDTAVLAGDVVAFSLVATTTFTFVAIQLEVTV